MERKLALLVEYLGTRYHGFQAQDNGDTVQARLEAAFQKLTGESTRLRGASRTDTGVHALGQVACFTTASVHNPETVRNALNFYLPEDIVAKEVCEVSHDVDPRRDAVRRWYRYAMRRGPTRSPLNSQTSLWIKDHLDVMNMGKAARDLVGTHNMASFSGPLPTADASTVRTVYRAEVTEEGEHLFFDIEANAFLPQQVRRMVGVLLNIGKGRDSVTRVTQLLANPVLGIADQPAQPQGLCLMYVEYPDQRIPFTAATLSHYHTKLPAFAVG